MPLTASPFHPVTGELLPVYLDAYLLGDLASKNNDLVDRYLKANPAQNAVAFARLHTLRQRGHAVRPVGWLQQQVQLARTEPRRFRQRAGMLAVTGALLTGIVLAAGRPAPTAPVLPPNVNYSAAAAYVAADAYAATPVSISGQVLNEKGQPLVGATVFDKQNGRGVSTDAQGNYTFTLPRYQTTQLQFGYGGYQESEVVIGSDQKPVTVTLLPRTKPVKRHWWSF